MNSSSKYNAFGLMLVGILGLLTACSEVVDLKTGNQAQRLVIYGKVTDGTAGNLLSIALTSTAGADQEPISGAEAMLLEDGVPVAQYEERTPGNYRLNFQGDSARVGRQYELLVTLADGRQYRSLPAIMPDLAAIDHGRFEASDVLEVVNQNGIAIERRRVRVFIDTEVLDQSKDFYLKWDIFETYSFLERLRVLTPPQLRPPCYVTNVTTGQEIYLFNGAEIKVPVIPDRLMANRDLNGLFANDYYFGIVQSTIDKSAYEYWELVDGISNTQGSIFDRPPAPVPGNFRNVNDPEEEVLGYFEVARSDTTFVRGRGDARPFYVPLACPGLPIGVTDEPAECTDCLLIENSTYHRPYFWF